MCVFSGREYSDSHASILPINAALVADRSLIMHWNGSGELQADKSVRYLFEDELGPTTAYCWSSYRAVELDDRDHPEAEICRIRAKPTR